MTERARHIAIIGGGITGLACARAVSKLAAAQSLAQPQSAPVRVSLFERSARVGGNIVTENRSGFVLDGGPDSWLSTKPDAEKLARALRLGPELIATVETHRGAYVAWGKDLHRIPEGLVLGVPTAVGPMITTGLFDWDAKLRMALEPLVPRRVYHGDEDESVASFMSRRLGAEMVDRLAAPLLGGIFAGDAEAISVRAAFPQFVAAERDHGSLIMAMRAQRRARAESTESPDDAKPNKGGFLSLRGGLGSLIQAIVDDLHEVVVRTSCPIQRIARLDPDDPRGRYALETSRGPEIADDIVFAGPTHAAADIVRHLDAPLAEAFDRAMDYASTATVFLAFKRAQVAHDLDATGFIVPRTLGRKILAATWVSSKWDHRAPGGHVLMRAFLGGAGRDEILATDDDALADLALRELRIFTPIEGRPLFTRTFRFHRASPQPYLGHLPRIRALTEKLSHHPGLYIAGSGIDGVGIPDCIRQAETIARQLMAST
ncbi:protoporphyrinogen oxidase [Pendulispora albinea]|uniref:Protoporphyrinogen oxidase n=1 Tax=Pendulispora albinea TaxID=2741071 RepID=A0ABZ2M351_9BACT